MKAFNYVITDLVGIHARPAGMLAKEAKKYESKITLTRGEKTAEATKLMAIMGLGVKHNDIVVVTIEGADEEQAFEDMMLFFQNNL